MTFAEAWPHSAWTIRIRQLEMQRHQSSDTMNTLDSHIIMEAIAIMWKK